MKVFWYHFEDIRSCVFYNMINYLLIGTYEYLSRYRKMQKMITAYYSKVCSKGPILLNDLVWIFPKSLYQTTKSISKKSSYSFISGLPWAIFGLCYLINLFWIFGKLSIKHPALSFFSNSRSLERLLRPYNRDLRVCNYLRE